MKGSINNGVNSGVIAEAAVTAAATAAVKAEAAAANILTHNFTITIYSIHPTSFWVGISNHNITFSKFFITISKFFKMVLKCLKKKIPNFSRSYLDEKVCKRIQVPLLFYSILMLKY